MDTKANDIFWNATIEDMKKGVIETEEEYTCILCGEAFQKGRIYEMNSKLYDAGKASQLHIQATHDSVLSYLLGMNPAFIGITEVQKELIKLIAQGLSDKEIAEELGVAQSTIRNHRYKLREKEKQARLYISMMELLSKETNQKINRLDKDMLCDAHKSATTLDDRYNITDKEKKAVLTAYMNENGGLKSYPAKEKKKIIVLEEIIKNFTKGKQYSQKEFDRILKRIYEDHATIRRALIEYGFIERTTDCSTYWIKE